MADLKITTQGKVLTASLVTKKGAFCHKNSEYYVGNENNNTSRMKYEKSLSRCRNRKSLLMFTSASILMNFVSRCFVVRAFKCLSIILDYPYILPNKSCTFMIERALCEYASMYVTSFVYVCVIDREKSKNFTCIDRTPYGRSGISLSHFQLLHPRNLLH